MASIHYYMSTLVSIIVFEYLMFTLIVHYSPNLQSKYHIIPR